MTGNTSPNPTTHYGKSNLLAEEYILKKSILEDKRFFKTMYDSFTIKQMQFKYVSNGIRWGLVSYENKRSYCSILNFFVIHQLINNEKIVSDIYNVADDETISTNNLIQLISNSCKKNDKIIKIPFFYLLN